MKSWKVMKLVFVIAILLMVLSSCVFAMPPEMRSFSSFIIEDVLPIIISIVWIVAIIMLLYIAIKCVLLHANEKAGIKTSTICIAITLINAAFILTIITWAIGWAM